MSKRTKSIQVMELMNLLVRNHYVESAAASNAIKAWQQDENSIPILELIYEIELPKEAQYTVNKIMELL